MNLWLDAIAAASVALSGGLLGYLFSRLPKPFWALGYFIPLALLLIYRIAGHYPAWFFTPPISWMMMGRKRFAILGFIAAMILTVPLCRLPRKRDRVAVILLMAMIILSMSIWPFLAPAFNRNQLLRLQTRMGADGVCRQNTDYTCGPAAAVTALRKLGLPADEGPIAVLSYTSAATGTPPDILAEALREQYGKDGLLAEYRAFRDLSELRKAGLTLAVIKFDFLVDHYVTVLEVTDSEVVVGDPLNGLDKMTYDEFRRKWRFVGVVLRLRAAASPLRSSAPLNGPPA